MTTYAYRSLTTDADLVTAAAAGELYQIDLPPAGPVARRVLDARGWLVVRAADSAAAVELATYYASQPVRSLERGLREMDAVVAVAWDVATA